MVAHTNVYLKANVSGLAAQQRILRRLEQSQRQKRHNTEFYAEKHKMSVKTMPNWLELQREEQSLYNKRMNARNVARAVGLAYGFIRGRSYRQMEQTAYSDPHWPTVIHFIATYHKEDVRVWVQRLHGWLEEGRVRLPKSQEPGIARALARVVAPSSLILP
jgi:hypothetical protein